MTMNKAILIGNLGRDPEIRETGSGLKIANLSLATTHRAKRDGEWTDQTEWHRVTVFGRQAETVGKFCAKGSLVCIEGRIQTRQWEDNEGNTRYTTEIVADHVRFLLLTPDQAARQNGGYGSSSGYGQGRTSTGRLGPGGDAPF